MTVSRRDPECEKYGFVYILGCSEGFYKIGRCKYVDDRIGRLKIQIPFKVRRYARLPTHVIPLDAYQGNQAERSDQ